jgi:hypothetical protein
MGDIARKAAMNPYASAAGLGGLAAGAATLGNLVSGEATQEGPGRLALEALGAGALGAAAGAYVPSMLTFNRGLRRAAAQHLENRGAEKRAVYDPATKTAYTMVGNAPDMNTTRQEYRDFSKGLNQVTLGTGGAALLAAGGLGGMLGGGAANVGSLARIPGLQQSMDPEGYGSSNTIPARSGVPTLRYA